MPSQYINIPLVVSTLNGQQGALTLVAGSNITITPGAGTLTIASTGGGGGSGTVTSVDMTVPSFLSVSGNPITTSGTLALTLVVQPANSVFVGPQTGADAAPTFRILQPVDVSTAVTAPHKVYVDFVSGNDSTGTGTLSLPWKSIQHAYTAISPSINEPYVMYISGGNNDPDSSPITGKPNVSIVADYIIQINQPITISGGTSNDGVSFTNIIFVGALTWIRNDNSVIGMNLVNCEFFSGPVFKQQGAGAATITAQNSVFVNADFLLPNFGSFFNNCTFLGTATFGDVTSAAYYELMSGYSSSSMSVSGGAQVYFSGLMIDEPFGASLTAVTTGNGTPVFQSDSGSLPSSVTGSPSYILTSFAQHESYTPSDSGKWAGPPPSTVQQALDRIAAVVGATIPIP